MQEYRGACACAQVRILLKSKMTPAQFQPRSDASTCGFCAKHDGVWISDPAGEFAVDPNSATEIKVFASEQVRFHFCKDCHELVFAAFGDSENQVAVARKNLFKEIAPFAQRTISTCFENETLEAGKLRRLKNWTKLRYE